MARSIKKATGGDDYRKLVRAFVLIAWGTAKQREKFFGEPVAVSARDRLEAMVELRDSGPGRPMQAFEIDPSGAVSAFTLPQDTWGVHVSEPGLGSRAPSTAASTDTLNPQNGDGRIGT